MKIISLNTWGGRRNDDLLEWIQKNPADIYCFQEVFSGPKITKENQFCIDNNNETVNIKLLQNLSDLLSDYKVYYSAGSKGYIHDRMWIDLPFEYGIAFFVHSNVKIHEYKSGMVHGTFRSTPPKSKVPLSRSAQVIRCSNESGTFTIGHIHGVWEPDGKHDTQRRAIQAKKFGKLIDSIAHKGDAIIACGDFNLLPNSQVFVKSKHQLKRNLIREYNIKSTRTKIYTKANRFADYVIANEATKFEYVEVLQYPIVSDHCPIVFSIHQTDSEILISETYEELFY